MLPISTCKQCSNCPDIASTTSASLVNHAWNTLHAGWEAWARQSLDGVGERRDIAVLRLKDCLAREQTELNLDGLGLTEIPPCLPTCVTLLDVTNNDLLCIKESDLHEGLQSLFASSNPSLDAIPAVLPSTLTVLHIANCDMQILPEYWMCVLVDLNAHGNPRLTALPETLPDSLQSINVSFCSLMALPQRLPPRLNVFIAIKNFITNLPETLTLLSSESFVNLMRNPLSNTVYEHLRKLMNDESYTGPRLYFDHPDDTSGIRDGAPDAMANWSYDDVVLATAQSDQSGFDADSTTASWPELMQPMPAVPLSWPEQESRRSLAEIMATWYPPNRQTDAVATWEAFATAPGIEEFLKFLNRLCTSINAASPEFREQVCQWLTELSKPEAQSLRERTFNVAYEASTNCEDRATLTLIQMQNASTAFDVEQGRYDEALPELITCARALFRQEALERIARAHIAQEIGADDVDVYLAFVVMLRTALKLRMAPQQMVFFLTSDIKQEHLIRAEQEVKRRENAEFADWLCQWPPWDCALKRIDPQRHQASQQARYDALENFDERLKARLSLDQLSGDADAQRIGGRRLLEQIALEHDRTLTEQCLVARQMAHLLAPVWPLDGALLA